MNQVNIPVAKRKKNKKRLTSTILYIIENFTFVNKKRRLSSFPDQHKLSFQFFSPTAYKYNKIEEECELITFLQNKIKY